MCASIEGVVVRWLRGEVREGREEGEVDGELKVGKELGSWLRGKA